MGEKEIKQVITKKNEGRVVAAVGDLQNGTVRTRKSYVRTRNKVLYQVVRKLSQVLK